MARTAEEIVELWRYRRNRSDIALSRMRRIRDTYNGDLVLPFAEDTEPAVANMVLMGIDQKAGRLASVMPQAHFPPMKPGTQKSEQKSVDQSHALRAWWDENDFPGILTSRARHLIAYGSSTVLMWPDVPKNTPRWRVRNPLGVFAADKVEYPSTPEDCITAYNKPFLWLRENYPAVADMADASGDLTDFSQIVLLEYSDADDIALVFAGVDTTWEPGFVTHQWETDTWGGFATDLIRVPNRVGRCLAVTATRPALDKEQGEFDQVIGMYGAQAKLTALELDAIERDIYPDMFLVSRAGEVADFVYGPVDGRSGEVNIVKGGEIESIHNQPGWMTTPAVDRLERAQRMTAGIPAEFGGESQTNVRTGRRGDAILSAQVDFPLSEAQRALAKSIKAEDDLAMDIAKAWWGKKKVSYHVIKGRQVKSNDYTPNTLFEGTPFHKITYPMAGADMNNLIVSIGQRVGLGIMSKRTASEIDPLIDDPEFEIDRITTEQLDAAMLASVANAAAEGQLSPMVVSRVIELVRSGQEELADAMQKATQEEAQRREAAQAAQPTPPAAAQEAAMGQQGIPPVAEAGQGLQNLRGLYQNLRGTGQAPTVQGG